MTHRSVFTRDGNRMNRHVRGQHNTSAGSRRHGLPFHTRLTFTLFLVFASDDLVLLVDGAGDFHGGGHDAGSFLGYLFLGRFLFQFCGDTANTS